MIKRFGITRQKILTMGAMLIFATLSWAQAQDKGKVEVLETNIEFNPSEKQAEPTVRPQEPVQKIHFQKETASKETPSGESVPSAAVINEGALREGQIIELNKTMKQMIEQYEMLEKEKEELDKELRFMRGQKRMEENRLNTINDEMRRVRAQTEQMINLNQQYSRQIVDMRLTMGDREKEYQLRIKELEDRLGSSMPAPTEMAMAKPEAMRSSAGTQKTDLVSMMDQINQEGERLKQDTAQVHYNMGNIFFHKGEYKKAAAEYKKVLKLMPLDVAAHFNLAFVSGEYLHDYSTALKHYREYLMMNPDAADAQLVREKVLRSEMAVDVRIDSPIDKPGKDAF